MLVTNTRVTGAPTSKYKIFGVRIDLSNSNPATSVTYTDDAAGMMPGSSWDTMPIFKNIKPCLFNGGQVVGYLNPNDFAQFEDGSAADIVSGTAGDVMIEFPRAGLSINTEGNIVTIKMTDNPNDPNFKYYAHTRGSQSRDYFYLGAYKGYAASSRLRSLSGKAPTGNQTIGTFRTYAQNNGAGYENSGFFQLTFRQCLYLIKYKNLDSQTTLGQGYVGGTAIQTTGATNTNGMDYGNPLSATSRVKLFGLEDFWGNIGEIIDGIYTNSSRNILTATDNFNDTGAGYTNQGQGSTIDLSGYISKPQGTTEKGFIIREGAGSATTFFADSGNLRATSQILFYGGYYSDASLAGIFRLPIQLDSTSAIASAGSRLMYL